MLSVKAVKIHGMKDNRWTIRDKLNQYRGILKLYAREKKLKGAEAARVRKRTSREFKTLKSEVKEYRGIVNEVENGDSRKIHAILQGHKDFLLAFAKQNPGVIHDAINEDLCLRRKQLDELFYLKRIKVKEFFDLKLECTVLEDKYEEQNLEVEPDRNQQQLVSLCQKYSADEEAARAIGSSYNSLLKILEKDSMYFNGLLDALRVDRDEQGKILFRATMMGQLAAEDLDDTRQRYKNMAKEVWKNMKERERTLKIAREEVQKLWANCKSLVRVESLTELKEIDQVDVNEGQVDENFKQEIHKLEEIFDRVKDTLMIRSYEELFTRFEDQARQRERLLEQFKKNFEERNLVLDKKNKAGIILANLDHSMITTTGDYKANKKKMLDDVEVQKKREDDFKKLRKTRGELLVNIKAALQNMADMLIHVKLGKVAGNKKTTKDSDHKKKKSRKKADIKDEKESDDDRSLKSSRDVLKLEKVDPDAINVLALVSKKVNILFNLSNFDLEENKEALAKNLYQKYVADHKSKLKFGEGAPEPTGIHVEHEVIDTSVLTRTDMKYRSKQLVETNTRLD